MACSRLSQAQFLPEEEKGIADALFIRNLSLQDLRSTRPLSKVPFRLEFIDPFLTDPMGAEAKIVNLHEMALRSKPSAVIGIARTIFLRDPVDSRKPLGEPKPVKLPTELPSQLAAPVRDLVLAVHEANLYCHEALAKLSAEEKRLLIDSLPGFAVGDCRWKPSFAKTVAKTSDHLLPLIAKVDLPLIRRASEVLALQTERAEPALLAAISANWKGRVGFTYDGINVIVNGSSNVILDQPGNGLLIDLGGYNKYTGRVGVGVIGASLLVSVGDHNLFEQQDLGAGCGLLGIGLAYIAGSAGYQSGSLAFGCGLAGVGLLSEGGAGASFKSESGAEGFGEFGIGILDLGPGSSKVSAKAWAQGAARTKGVGWLLGKDGDGVFTVEQHCGQGCSAGYDDADGQLGGGVGLFSKRGGNDKFVGGELCQSAALSFGFASFYKANGDDNFEAETRSQSFAFGESCSYFLHLKGSTSCHREFSYESQTDEGSTRLLLSRGACPNRIDPFGPMMYLGSGEPNTLNPMRRPMLLVSLTANGIETDFDRVGESPVDPAFAIDGIRSGMWSDPKPIVKLVAPSRETVALITKVVQDFQLASNETLGEIQRELATAALLSHGMNVFSWLLDHELKNSGAGARWTIGLLASSLGEQARSALALKIADPDDFIALHALQICTQYRFKECAPLVLGTFTRPALTQAATRAAETFPASETVGTLMVLAGQHDESTVLAATRALAAIGDSQSISTGQALLSSRSHLVREAAIRLVARMPGALQIGKQLAMDPDEQVARTGMRILAEIASKDSFAVIGQALSNMKSGVRIEALLSFGPSLPNGVEATLKSDPSPLVRAVLAGLTYH